MTKEQIEDLNQLSRDHYWTDGDRDDLRKALPRLLEERQRLLAAVRAAVKNAFDDDPETWGRIDAEIAFAEEEAK